MWSKGEFGSTFCAACGLAENAKFACGSKACQTAFLAHMEHHAAGQPPSTSSLMSPKALPLYSDVMNEELEGVEPKTMEDKRAADEDEDIEEMKRKLNEMEAEAKKLEQQLASPGAAAASPSSTAASDSKSIYIGNVDYSTTSDELREFFKSCGAVKRVTIPEDAQKKPKGYAYLEFEEMEAVTYALVLNETEFKGRMLKIISKRTNVSGFNASRGGRGRGRGRGAGFAGAYPSFAPRGGYRGRGRGGYDYYAGFVPRGRGRGRGRGAYY